MGHPKRQRNVKVVADETLTPPDSLTSTQFIAKISKGEGNNIYSCTLPSSTSILVELPARFRSTIWMKRGTFVLVDSKEAEARENKIAGEIVNVVREESAWRKMEYWPKEFVKDNSAYEDSEDDEEESNVGKMPPSSDSEDE